MFILLDFEFGKTLIVNVLHVDYIYRYHNNCTHRSSFLILMLTVSQLRTTIMSHMRRAFGQPDEAKCFSRVAGEREEIYRGKVTRKKKTLARSDQPVGFPVF